MKSRTLESARFWAKLANIENIESDCSPAERERLGEETLHELIKFPGGLESFLAGIMRNDHLGHTPGSISFEECPLEICAMARAALSNAGNVVAWYELAYETQEKLGIPQEGRLIGSRLLSLALEFAERAAVKGESP